MLSVWLNGIDQWDNLIIKQPLEWLSILLSTFIESAICYKLALLVNPIFNLNPTHKPKVEPKSETFHCKYVSQVDEAQSLTRKNKTQTQNWNHKT